MVRRNCLLILLIIMIVLVSCSKKVEIIFNTNGGNQIATIQNRNDFDVNNLPQPIKDGFIFDGWFLDSAFITPIVGNVPTKLNFTLYAKWVEKYTITFDSNGGTVIPSLVAQAGVAILKPTDPTKEFHQFVDWYQDSSLYILFNFLTMPNENLTLYAKWKPNNYTITFDSTGGSTIDNLLAPYNSTITEPINPTKYGHSFGGWYSDNSLTTPFDFNTMPGNDIQLYAKWIINEYTVSFESNGGTQVNSITALFGSVISKPSDPIKEGFEFEGWFVDELLSTPYSFTTMQSSNIMLYAKWRLIPEYTISFDTGGGTAVDSITVEYNETISILPTSSMDNFVFKGWLLNGIMIKLPFIYQFKNDSVLIAVWEGIEELFTYEIIDDYVKITGYQGNINELILPITINNLPVKEIGPEVFKDNLSLNSIVVGPNVTTIGDRVFEGCSVLKKVEFANVTQNFGKEILRNCSLLETITISSEVTFTLAYLFNEYDDSYFIPSTLKKIKHALGGNSIDKTLVSGEIPPITLELADDITSIEEYTFSDCLYLANVIIPNGVTRISGFAFSNCHNLRTIIIPSTLTTIQNNAFSLCQNLINIILPINVETLEENAFIDCHNLMIFSEAWAKPDSWDNDWNSSNVPVCWNYVETRENDTFKYAVFSNHTIVIMGLSSMCLTSDITIPEMIDNKNVTKFLPYAFEKSLQIKSVNFINTAVNLEVGLFSWCYNLEEIYFNPNSQINQISDYAFQGCNKLKQFLIPVNVTTIGISAFFACGIKDIIIPSGVQTIGDNAFQYCNSLTTINLPSSLTIIGASAFKYCSNLITISIPGGVKNLNDQIFSYCSNLTTVELGDGLLTIGYNAFYNCNKLTLVNLPESLEIIDNNAFYYCENLVNINLPANLTKIGSYAFSYCQSLTSVVIPEGVTIIEQATFNICSNLINVELPNTVNKIGPYAFNSCKNLTNISIPDSVTLIETAAFAFCESLKSIIIPENVTEINDATFSGCKSLKMVDMPDAITIIGSSAFINCESLLSVFIPSSVTEIKNNAFQNCLSLANVVIPSTVIIRQKVFYNDGRAVFFTDALSKPSIWDKNWNPHNVPVFWGRTNLKEDDVFKYEIMDDNSITIIGMSSKSLDTELTIPDLIENKPVIKIIDYAFYCNTNIKSIVVSNGITSIGEWAFANCKDLTSVDFANTINNINKFAFYHCESLLSIDIPHNVMSIKQGVFNSCYNLKTANIPASVTTIDYGAFNHCESLESIVIPDSVTKIDGEAFNGCKSLSSVYLSSNLVTLGSNSFSSCTSLRNVSLPSSLKIVGSYMFADCTNLTTVSIPEGVEEIGYSSFSGCSSLVKIVLSNTVIKIKALAFYDCANLVKVYLPSSVAIIEEYAFMDWNSNLIIYAEAESAGSWPDYYRGRFPQVVFNHPYLP